MKAKQSETNTPKLPEDVEQRFDEWRQSGQSYMNPQDFVDGWHEGRLKQFIAQELSTIKAQVRKEIEEKRDDWKGLEEMTTTDIAGEIYRALDDCLSIPSLKGEE